MELCNTGDKSLIGLRLTYPYFDIKSSLYLPLSPPSPSSPPPPPPRSLSLNGLLWKRDTSLKRTPGLKVGPCLSSPCLSIRRTHSAGPKVSVFERVDYTAKFSVKSVSLLILSTLTPMVNSGWQSERFFFFFHAFLAVHIQDQGLISFKNESEE